MSLALKKSRWLLVFNCQAIGLGNCLNLLSDKVSVEAFDPASFKQHEAAILSRLPSYEKVLVLAAQPGTRMIEPDRHPDVWQVPGMVFHGYHPDLCYLADSGPLADGLLQSAYHSAIAYAAWRNGLDVQQALRLYRNDIYEKLGYFDVWDSERDRLLKFFTAYGFDMSQAFVEWSRSGAFMYSCNHPKIHCLRDLAAAILERAGHVPLKTGAMPHDNLANGPYFPVYPEIGARLGVKGDHGFKPAGSYELVGLEGYVSASFALYEANRDARPSYAPYFEMIERAIQVVAAES
jgi:hypothetical protein